MGIFIHVAVSTSVTQDEWTKVYEESLKMADALNLAEYREMIIHGVSVDCLTKTKEREFASWDNNPNMEWWANGDYDCLTICEDNYLRRYIRYHIKSDAVDPLLALSRIRETGYDKESPFQDDYVEFWDGKTQGEPQHMSLLAIGCMMEDRLKDRAFVFGDISRGQIRQAVQLANKILEEPIQEPDCCDLQRFFERIQKFRTDEKEKLFTMQEFYMGPKDAAYGQFLREHFSKETLEAYWQKRFHGMPVDRVGYSAIYKEYLVQGFDFAGLCRFSNLTDKDGQDLTETFVRKIIKSELYIQEKDCKDILELNTDKPGTYSVSSLLAQFVFGGMRNPRVDRYISLDEIRKTLNEELGSRCDVDGIIDKCLAEKKTEEKSRSDVFTESVNHLVEKQQKKRKDYDISDYGMLIGYRTGNTIAPGIQRNVVHLHEFCKEMFSKYADEYEELSKGEPEKKLRALAHRSSAFAIRDKDWEKIFTDIEEHPDSFARYWPVTLIEVNSEDVRSIIQGYLISDDLYHDLESGKLKMVDKEGE